MSSGTLCADRQLHHMISHLDDIVPPRNKLIFSDHLPTNDAVSLYLHDTNDNNYLDDDSSSDPYATDHFRMYDFKVRRCTRSRSHDWTDCPFAHTGEKARRRDPRRFRYCSTVCSDYRRGVGCPRGDDCEFAHGVFECWLHPTRYRTEPCKDGKNCKRKVCFFAHSSRELRILSDLSPKYPINSCSSPVIGDKTTTGARCCLFCRSVSSPTSTLLGLSHFSRSPSLSPPMSPVAHQRRAATGLSPSKLGAEAVSYKEILSELVRSLEGIGISQEVCSPAVRSRNANGFLNLPLIQDLHNQAVITDAGSGDDSFEILGAPAPPYNHGDEEDYWCSNMKDYENECGLGGGGSADPDLGWVNDLLM